MTIAALILAGFAYALRLAPRLFVGGSTGVDQWFWRAYVDALRRDRTFPPRLPQFLLDAAQWYPPLFPVLMARIPAALFEKHAHHLAIVIDIMRLLLLVAATDLITGSAQASLVAGAVYAVTPLLVTYNMQLNPRGLGALFLDAMWLAVGALMLSAAPVWLWLVVCALGGLILLTHKMTTQLMVFTSICAAFMTQRVMFLAIVPLSMITAFILSGGFYRRVLQAHGDIVAFWYRNWRWSGSHPVLESPAYGEAGFESPNKYYSSGMRAWLRRLMFVVGFNPWVPTVLLLGILAHRAGHQPATFEAWAFGWLAVTFAFALLTTLVPALRCFGQGYLYGYNGSFPAALALGITWQPLGNTWQWEFIVAAAGLASIAVLAAYVRQMRSSLTMKVDTNLDSAMAQLAGLPKGAVMCLPQHWHDAVAYRTGHPVVFGGHGYGFSLLQPVFPRLLMPIGDIIRAHNVRYLLTYRGYCNDKLLADLPAHSISEHGSYQTYIFALGTQNARSIKMSVQDLPSSNIL